MTALEIKCDASKASRLLKIFKKLWLEMSSMNYQGIYVRCLVFHASWSPNVLNLICQWNEFIFSPVNLST